MVGEGCREGKMFVYGRGSKATLSAGCSRRAPALASALLTL